MSPEDREKLEQEVKYLRSQLSDGEREQVKTIKTALRRDRVAHSRLSDDHLLQTAYLSTFTILVLVLSCGAVYTDQKLFFGVYLIAVILLLVAYKITSIDGWRHWRISDAKVEWRKKRRWLISKWRKDR
jgi:amino acid transporter